MEIFGIGIGEVFLIIIIALIILGPQDTIKAGRNLGRAVRRFFSSEEWRTLLQASKEIRTIPEKLMEETGLDHPEDIFPSEAEIREQAGLNDLQKDVASWNADLEGMKKGTNLDTTGSERILPPQPAVHQAASQTAAPAREAGLEDVERDLSQWKADLSAWGSSKVIVPIPQPPAAEPAPDPSENGQAPASTESGQAPASAEAPVPPQDQSQSEPPEEEPETPSSQKQGEQ